jgi:hypothetical protein
MTMYASTDQVANRGLGPYSHPMVLGRKHETQLQFGLRHKPLVPAQVVLVAVLRTCMSVGLMASLSMTVRAPPTPTSSAVTGLPDLSCATTMRPNLQPTRTVVG